MYIYTHIYEGGWNGNLNNYLAIFSIWAVDSKILGLVRKLHQLKVTSYLPFSMLEPFGPLYLLSLSFPDGTSGKEPTCQWRRCKRPRVFLGQENPLEEGTAAHSGILIWKIPWTEEPGGLQSIVLQRVGHDWSDIACTHTRTESREVTEVQSMALHIRRNSQRQEQGCMRTGP